MRPFFAVMQVILYTIAPVIASFSCVEFLSSISAAFVHNVHKQAKTPGRTKNQRSSRPKAVFLKKKSRCPEPDKVQSPRRLLGNSLERSKKATPTAKLLTRRHTKMPPFAIFWLKAPHDPKKPSQQKSCGPEPDKVKSPRHFRARALHRACTHWSR